MLYLCISNPVATDERARNSRNGKLLASLPEAFTKGDVYAARKRMGFEGEPAYVISRWLSKGLIAKSKLEKGKFVKIEQDEKEKMVRGER